MTGKGWVGGCSIYLKSKTLPGFLIVNGLAIRFIDDLGLMLSMLVLWTFQYLLDFPAGKRLAH
jgi:hypothetical protein